MATTNNKKDKHIETSLKEMSEKDRKSLLKTTISLLFSAIILCVLAINMFSCRSEAEFEVPEIETDYVAVINNQSFQPVGKISWIEVPDCLKSVLSISFSGVQNNQFVVRIISDSGSEEGIFTLTDKAQGTLSVLDVSFTVHISDDSIRLINDSSESLDFILIK